MLCGASHPPPVERRARLAAEAERVQHQHRRLVARVVGTVPEEHTRPPEAARAALDEHGDGRQPRTRARRPRPFGARGVPDGVK